MTSLLLRLGGPLAGLWRVHDNHHGYMELSPGLPYVLGDTGADVYRRYDISQSSATGGEHSADGVWLFEGFRKRTKDDKMLIS